MVSEKDPFDQYAQNHSTTYGEQSKEQQGTEQEENLEGQHIIHGKKVREGGMTTYTDQAGVKHDAVIKKIHPADYFADLEARVDGSSKFFERVPFNPSGNHAWNHKQQQDEEGHSITHSSRTGRPHEVSGESDQQTDNG